MTWNPATITIKDASGTEVPMMAYTDGTKLAFARPVLDDTGAIISPATANNQATANASLAAIAAQTNGVATAANQAAGNTLLLATATSVDNLDDNLGAKADTPASTDTGTFSLISLFKRSLVTLTALSGSVATATKQDAQTTALGAPGDAAVTNPASSASIIASLKGILTGVNAATPAGANVIGKVTFDQTTPGTTDSVTVAIGQGAGATIGAANDALVAAGAAGTLSAKLRRLTQGIEDLKTQIVLAASSNVIGGVVPTMSSGGHTSATTAATGTNWTAFSSQALKQLTVSNQTGVTLEFRQGAGGVALQIPTSAFYTFFGLTNANQIDVRRVDNSNTQVTVTARWES